MKKYEIEIEGVASSLQNRLSQELIDEMKGIHNEQKLDWERKNWRKK